MRELVRSYGKPLALVCWFYRGVVLVESVVLCAAYTSSDVLMLDKGMIFVQTPGGHDMLIDGGPNNKVLEGLREKMKYSDISIDVVVTTHADADHITGLIPSV